MKSIQHLKRVYFLVTVLFWMSVAIPLPIFILLVQARGASLVEIGLVMGIYSLTVVLLEVPTGGLADSVGRKRVALIAYAFSLLSSVVLFFAFSFSAFLITSILSGIARALSSGALDAWFIDSLQELEPDIDLQPPLAQAGTITLLALGTGTLAGGVLPMLFDGLPAEGSVPLTPLSTTVIASIIIQLILIAAMMLLVKDTRSSEAGLGMWRQSVQDVPILVRDAFALNMSNPILMRLLGAALVSGLVIASVETFWQPQFAMLMGGNEVQSIWFGVIMTGSFLAGMVGNMASVPLSRRLNKRYALVAAVTRGVQGIFLILLAMQSGVLGAAILFWLVYANMGILESPHATLVNNEISSERRSAMLSVQSLATYGGAAIGSILFGYISQLGSIRYAWIVAGLIAVVSLWLYISVDIRKKRHAQDHHEQEIPVFDAG